MQRRAFILVLAAASLAAPAFAARGPLSDDAITDQVRVRLASDPVVKGGALGVQCKDGVVTLTGRVAEPRQETLAVKLAKRVRGVKAVVNNIAIAHP